jgi:hypothetical protein
VQLERLVCKETVQYSWKSSSDSDSAALGRQGLKLPSASGGLSNSRETCGLETGLRRFERGLLVSPAPTPQVVRTADHIEALPIDKRASNHLKSYRALSTAAWTVMLTVANAPFEMHGLRHSSLSALGIKSDQEE